MEGKGKREEYVKKLNNPVGTEMRGAFFSRWN